jgi:hypothetical protein
MYNTFRKHNWYIPGYEVVFDVYCTSPLGDQKCLWKVEKIQGSDFALEFNMIQGYVSELRRNDLAGFSEISIKRNVTIRFYEDRSGPTIHQYSEDQEWGLGNILGYIEGLFLSDKEVALNRIKEKKSHFYFTDCAASYLTEVVIPNLETVINSLT